MSTGPIREMVYSRRQVRDADYLVGTCGTGAAVLLLHGFPQTHYCWRHVVPVLSQGHTVVATDLRGYGATTAPAGGPEGQGFSKREMALDLVQLMDGSGSVGSRSSATTAAHALRTGWRSTTQRGSSGSPFSISSRRSTSSSA
jgi:pimeloyl-ACP methyl ester carboxylesterase